MQHRLDHLTAPIPHTAPATDVVPVRHYAQRFSSTRRGVRLARLMGTQQLADWGMPHDTDAGRTTALLIAELTTNAALHAPPPGPRLGRDFQLRLTLRESEQLLVEVSDAYGERRPSPAPPHACPYADTGRGLLLVDALALRWGVTDLPPSGKTVWCEVGTGG